MSRILKRFLVTSSLKSILAGNDPREKKIFVHLSQEETHHLKDVLHLKEGSECILIDRMGHECHGRVEGFHNDLAKIRLTKWIITASQLTLNLSVAQAIPQDRKMDEIVRKSAELGIDKLIPLITERTIVRMKENQFQKVNERWDRILVQAAKQSRVSKLPQIKPITSFKDLISTHSECEYIFLLHPTASAKPIREIKIETGNVLLLIGPEGGFSDEEVKLAESKGAKLIRMGSEIMRTDTAFVAATSFFKLMSY